jgi:hypothetical protein
VKVIEIAVTACGIPVLHTRFPFSEGINEIIQFMNDTWPSNHPEHQPSFLANDKGCQVMLTLHVNRELIGNGGCTTTDIRLMHYVSTSVILLTIRIPTWSNYCKTEIHVNHRILMDMNSEQ